MQFILLNSNAQIKSDSSDVSSLIEKYRVILSDEMEKNNIVGLSIAVVDNDSIIWSEGFGLYDTIKNIKVSEETPFLIGSITKLFTGVAVMQLQEKGLLNIDSSYVKYVPEFKMKTNYGTINDITIRSMMTHHAGIPGIDVNQFSKEPEYFTKLIDYVNNDYATNPVNTIFRYSNSGISLLGNLIENVSKDSYFEFINKSILNPIEMKNSGFFTSKNQPASCLFGYNENKKQFNELPLFDIPAGGLYASAADMGKFIRAFILSGKTGDPKFLTQASQNEMTNVQNRNVFYDLGNTTGLIGGIHYTDIGKLFSHSSSTLFHKGSIEIASDAGLGIVMLSNSSNANRIYYYMEIILNELGRIKGIKPDKPEFVSLRNPLHLEHIFVYKNDDNIDILTVSVNDLAKYIGTYAASDLVYEVRMDKGHLLLDFGIYGKKYLLPVKNNEFVPADTTLKLNTKERYYFQNFDNNTYLIQVYENGFQEIWGTKIINEPINKLWINRLGDYKIVNETENEKEIKLKFDSNLMILSYSGDIYNNYRPLKIINDNLAIVFGFGRISGSALQFIKDESGKEYLLFKGFKGMKK